MIADAPTATSSSATPLPATGQTSSATTPTVVGAISPCRRIGFIRFALLQPFPRRGRRAHRRGSEAITAAAHGFDQGIRAKRLERRAQAPDVDIDGALLDVDVIAPHQVEKLAAAMNAIGPRHQEAQ